VTASLWEVSVVAAIKGLSKSLVTLTLGLVALGLVGGAGIAVAAPTLAVRDGYVREMPPGQTVSAAFMILQNDTAKTIAIVAASSDAADKTELHNHRHTAGGMRMEKVVRLEIPAKSAQTLQPGGYHLMLIGLKRPLRAGETVRLTLIDEMGRTYGAAVPVQRIDGAGEHAHH
jgi:copper(I)-binding protein